MKCKDSDAPAHISGQGFHKKNRGFGSVKQYSAVFTSQIRTDLTRRGSRTIKSSNISVEYLGEREGV